MNELKDKDNEINKLNLKICELISKIEEKDNLLNKYLIDMKEEQNKILVSEEKIKDLSNVINQLQKELNSSINTNTNSNTNTIKQKEREKTTQNDRFHRRFRCLYTSSNKIGNLTSDNNNIDININNNEADKCNTIAYRSSHNDKEPESCKNIGLKKFKEEEETIDFTPENYIIIKSFKLANKLKWFLFKNNKNASTPKFISNTFHKRTSLRLFRNKSNDPRKNNIDLDGNNNNTDNFGNDSFGDFIWKPQKTRNEFIDFNTAQNIYNDSIDKEKKFKIWKII